MIIGTVDHIPLPSREQLLAALQEEFGPAHVRLADISRSLSTARFHISVAPPAEPPFGVRELATGELIVDGTAEQDARVAARVRALLPASYSRVVALTDDGGSFVDLVPGMTPLEIHSGWRNIAEGGF